MGSGLFTQKIGVGLLRKNLESSKATLTRRSFFFVRWMGIEVSLSRRNFDVFVHGLNVLFLWCFGLLHSNAGCRAVDREDGKF